MNQSSTTDLFFSLKKDIDTNFHISLSHHHLPIAFSPCRIEACMVGVCIKGNAMVEIDLLPYNITTNDIVIVFPGQILASIQTTNDYTLAYFTFSGELIDDVLYRFPTAFIGFLRENVTYHLPQEEKDALFSEYFTIINNKFSDINNVCRSEIVLNLLHNFYLDLYSKVIVRNEIHSRQPKRKKEIQEEFFKLIKTHSNKREVAFYANKLCITPKYLSIITKESTGNSAKELIDKFAITELKLQLKSTSTPLKEIAAQLNYPSEAFLCKFFKKHTSLTPSHYRNASK